MIYPYGVYIAKSNTYECNCGQTGVIYKDSHGMLWCTGISSRVCGEIFEMKYISGILFECPDGHKFVGFLRRLNLSSDMVTHTW